MNYLTDFAKRLVFNLICISLVVFIAWIARDIWYEIFTGLEAGR